MAAKRRCSVSSVRPASPATRRDLRPVGATERSSQRPNDRASERREEDGRTRGGRTDGRTRPTGATVGKPEEFRQMAPSGRLVAQWLAGWLAPVGGPGLAWPGPARPAGLWPRAKSAPILSILSQFCGSSTCSRPAWTEHAGVSTRQAPLTRVPPRQARPPSFSFFLAACLLSSITSSRTRRPARLLPFPFCLLVARWLSLSPLLLSLSAACYLCLLLSSFLLPRSSFFSLFSRGPALFLLLLPASMLARSLRPGMGFCC